MSNKIIENELIHSFLLLTRVLNCEIGYDDLIFKIGSTNEIIEEDLLYVATEYYNLKTKKVSVKLENLKNNPLPAIVKLKNNRYSLLFSVENSKYTIYDFENKKQISLNEDEFIEIYDKELILISKDDKKDTDLANSSYSTYREQYIDRAMIGIGKLNQGVLIQRF